MAGRGPGPAPRRTAAALLRRAAEAALLLLGYVALERLGRVVSGPGQALLLAPAAALSFAYAVMRGRSALPVLIAGPILAGVPGLLLWDRWRLLPAAVAGALAWTGVVELMRRRGWRGAFDGPLDAARFLLVGGAVAPGAAALAGNLGLALGGLLPADRLPTLIGVTWLAGAVAVLTLSPPFLLAASALGRRTASGPQGLLAIRGATAGEAFLVGAALLALTTFSRIPALADAPGPLHLRTPLAGLHLSYLTLLPVIWAARRGGLSMAALASLAVTALSAALSHADLPTRASVVDAQGLLIAVAIVALVLGSDTRRRTGAERQLNHQTLHDPLTSLPNRYLLLDRMTHALERSQHDGAVCGVVVVGLDRFTAVNETYGHDSGDRVLRAVAWRMAIAVRPTDTVARISNDEFAVLLEDLHDPADAPVIADQVLQSLELPITIGEHEVVLRASVGVVSADAAHLNADRLIADAEIAMRRAKAAGGSRFEVFDAQLDAVARRRLALEKELRLAISDGSLRLLYQPIVAAADQRVEGVEALLRWVSRTQGAVGPAQLIPLAEEAGLIAPVGAWVLSEACRQGALWQESGGSHNALHVAVNISPRHLRHRDFVRDVQAALTSSGLPPNRLVIEVTETMLIDDFESAAVVLQAVRDLGVRIHVDDFGTGYSSLSYLARLPFDALKIDQSFVRGITTDRASRAIVASIVALAHTLDLRVVAEGVERPEQMAALIELGCESMQGMLFGKPGTAQDLAPRPLAG